jgi:hypothetical protein
MHLRQQGLGMRHAIENVQGEDHVKGALQLLP